MTMESTKSHTAQPDERAGAGSAGKDGSRSSLHDVDLDLMNGKGSGNLSLVAAPSPPEDDDDEESTGLPTPPDGGWGWVIVFSSFMIHVIADGVAYSFGVFLVEFVEFFGTGRGSTSWLGSLMIGVTWGCGPIASALTNKYGCRRVTIAGGLVAFSGFFISLFAPNIYFLYFSFGIIAGLGLGLIYVPAIVSVTFYFEKKRSFATGLAVCGSGIGTFLFAPLTQMLLYAYGNWTWAVLIEAAILLNCCVCGALLRPLASSPKRKRKPLAEHCNDDDEDSPHTNAATDAVELKVTVSDSAASATAAAVKNGGVERLKREDSAQSLPHHLLTLPHQDSYQAKKNQFSSDMCIHQVHKTASHEAGHDSAKSHHNPGPMDRKDIFYTGSLQNIPLYKSNPGLYSQSMRSIPKELNDDEDQDLAGGDTIAKKPCCKTSLMDGFSLEWQLLKDPVLLIFCLSNFLTSLGFCVPYTFLPDRAALMGLSKDKGAMLISMIGVGNTVGRVFFGYISDKPCVNRLYLYSTVLTLCGVSTALSAFCNSYELLAVYSVLFGLFLGVYVSLTSVVLVDLMGLEKLTSSFGLVLLFEGIAAVVGPPIAGWVFDATQTYDASFYIMGTMIALSGLILYPVPLVQKWKNRHHQRETPDEIILGKKPSGQKSKPVLVFEDMAVDASLLTDSKDTCDS